MTRKPLKIIGINPGTRYLGIAILDGAELLDCRIKVLDGKWSKDKMKKAMGIISIFIKRYEPTHLAIKKLHPSRRSQNLNRLVVKTKDLSRRRGLRIHQYSIKEMEGIFVEDEKLNKKNLAEAICSEYPALFHELQKEKRHKNPYYTWMFEAVALASACFHQLDNH